MDAHKWFFQPYEAGALLVKDVSTLERAFAVRHDILRDTIWGANHPNFSDRGLQLSRSCRALKVWMSVQTFGVAAFRRAVSRRMKLAGQAEAGLGEEALEEINRTVLVRIFWDDKEFVSSTLLNGKLALRFCISNHNTTWDDVRETIERFGKEALG